MSTAPRDKKTFRRVLWGCVVFGAAVHAMFLAATRLVMAVEKRIGWYAGEQD